MGEMGKLQPLISIVSPHRKFGRRNSHGCKYFPLLCWPRRCVVQDKQTLLYEANVSTIRTLPKIKYNSIFVVLQLEVKYESSKFCITVLLGKKWLMIIIGGGF